MPSQYQVNISMSGETVTSLSQNGFSLYGFQVVQSSSGGSPTVWFQTNDFALNTAIVWSVNYQAYTSQSQIIPQGTITADASYPADLGQVLTVSNPMGIGDVSDTTGTGAMQMGISIINQTTTPFTCGISQQQPSGGFGPICAFPLFGNNMDVIVPIEQVFLMFSSIPVNTGTVIEQAYGPGILINVTDPNTQSVSYDINQGWSWAEMASWAQAYPPNQSLVPLLIQPVATLGPQ
jgi:hypothetical protein